MSKRDEERGAIIPPPPVPDELMPAEKAQPARDAPKRPTERTQQFGPDDLKPITAAQVVYERKESVTYSCKTLNFRVRINDDRVEKLIAEGDDETRLNILGEWLTPTSRVIYPGEFESERDAIYKRLALEHGLPAPKKKTPRTSESARAEAAYAIPERITDEDHSVSLLEG